MSSAGMTAGLSRRPGFCATSGLPASLFHQPLEGVDGNELWPPWHVERLEQRQHPPVERSATHPDRLGRLRPCVGESRDVRRPLYDHRWGIRGRMRVTLRLFPRDDRDAAAPLFPDVTADRLRTAIARSCRAAGVPVFSPRDLRHRRISSSPSGTHLGRDRPPRGTAEAQGRAAENGPAWIRTRDQPIMSRLL
jgi:hypothetical protein